GEVEVGRGRCFDVGGVHGDEARHGGAAGRGHVHDHAGRTRRGDADVDRRRRTGCVAGVENPGGTRRREVVREVAGHVDDEVGGRVGVQAQRTVGGDGDDGGVGRHLAGGEVEVRRQRWWAARIRGDVPARGRAAG